MKLKLIKGIPSLQIIDVFWFVEGGIVKVNKNDVVKYYIRGVGINNEHDDAMKIVEQGTEFPKHVGDVLFSKVNK